MDLREEAQRALHDLVETVVVFPMLADSSSLFHVEDVVVAHGPTRSMFSMPVTLEVFEALFAEWYFDLVEGVVLQARE